METKKKPAPVFEVIAEKEGYAIQRNGRYLMTPAGASYLLPVQALAEEIAAEWRAQGEKIIPATMPLTQLFATAQDIVRKDREKIIGGLLAYTGSELLCHRAEGPASLCAKQQELWQPLLDWCSHHYGVAFAVGCGVMPIVQSPDVAAKLRPVLEALDNYRLAGLSSAVDSAGSLVLGLALAEGARTADEVLKLSELDVAHQAIMWGEDPVTKARQDSVQRDLQACEKWFGLLKG